MTFTFHLRKFQYTLHTICGLDNHDRVVVGVSGGADSMCLVDLLRRAQIPIIVAHFNHLIRKEAAEDEACVAKYASKWNLPFFVQKGNVIEKSKKLNLSVEEAARMMRYTFLFALASEEGAKAVAVGHTSDDQVETILLHIIRGTGMEGLRGMDIVSDSHGWHSSIPLIRPILNLSHDETMSYCEKNGIPTVIDQTNFEGIYLRNKVRNQVLPLLTNINPGFKTRLINLSDIIGKEDDHLRQIVEDFWNRNFSVSNTGLMVNKSAFMNLPIALKRRIILKVADSIPVPKALMTYMFVQKIINFIFRNMVTVAWGRMNDFLSIWIGSDLIYFYKPGENPFQGMWPAMDENCVLFYPGEEILLKDGWKFHSTVIDRQDYRKPQTRLPLNAFIHLPEKNNEFQLRVRTPGDRFQPLGMLHGSQKVSDVMINYKIPVMVRDSLPMVLINGTIAWVPGAQISERYKVCEDTKQVLVLQMSRLGQSE